MARGTGDARERDGRRIRQRHGVGERRARACAVRAALRAATEQERQRLGVGQALVVEQASGQAARAGLQPGDVVLSVNGTPVANIGALMTEIDAAHGNVALLIQRGGARLYVPIEIG